MVILSVNCGIRIPAAHYNYVGLAKVLGKQYRRKREWSGQAQHCTSRMGRLDAALVARGDGLRIAGGDGL